VHQASTQQTATHCNRLQHIVTRCNNDAQHGDTEPDVFVFFVQLFQLTTTHYITLQHTATHCINDAQRGNKGRDVFVFSVQLFTVPSFALNLATNPMFGLVRIFEKQIRLYI